MKDLSIAFLLVAVAFSGWCAFVRWMGPIHLSTPPGMRVDVDEVVLKDGTRCVVFTRQGRGIGASCNWERPR